MFFNINFRNVYVIISAIFGEEDGTIRFNYIDLSRGAGIILVILAHISYISEGSRIFIVSFHMPLFFVISGILIFIKNEEERSLKDTAVHKLKSIMIPYFLYSLLGILIYIVYYLLTGRDGGWSAVISHIIETLTLYGFSVMWFLPAIFLSELFFLLILKKPGNTGFLLLVSVLIPVAAALILNSNLEAANALYGTNPAFAVFHLFAVALLRVPVCASFIAAGYFASSLLPAVFSNKDNPVSGLLTPAEAFMGINLMGLTIVFSRINGVTDLHFLIFNNILLYYLAALSGSFGVILIFRALEGFSSAPPLRLLRYFGKNSLIIMVTHLNFYVLLAAEIGGMHFTKTLNEGALKHFVFILLTLIFTLCGEVILIEGINRVSLLRRK